MALPFIREHHQRAPLHGAHRGAPSRRLSPPVRTEKRLDPPPPPFFDAPAGHSRIARAESSSVNRRRTRADSQPPRVDRGTLGRLSHGAILLGFVGRNRLAGHRAFPNLVVKCLHRQMGVAQFSEYRGLLLGFRADGFIAGWSLQRETSDYYL